MENNYIELNRDSWDKRTEVHLRSDFFNVPAFLNGKNSLPQLDLELLGDIKNKNVLHLQCHFGQDTISMARMGATVTGVDLSNKAIEAARDFNSQLKLN